MRAIVSTPDVLGGRWRLDGTRIHASIIRNWITEFDLTEFNEQFPHVELTHEEADAVLAWPFPPIHNGPIPINLPDELVCACGEDADLRDDGAGEEWHCPYCGKDWMMTVRIEQAAATGGEATR